MCRCVNGLVVLMVWFVVCSAAVAQAEMAVESPASEPEVILTQALVATGFEVQFAHDVALLATAGVIRIQLPEVCLSYLVTLHWCEVIDGTPIYRAVRFRLGAECFHHFFPPDGICPLPECPLGMKPFHKLRANPSVPLGLPSGVCVYAEFEGPVETVCDISVACEVLPDLASESCDDLFECVPATPTDNPKPGFMPEVCPQCD
ncbi:MAG: hypothetical protein KF724_01995 [Phycisphaeraceae bacterium]|nr:hypothetical protein [Phycisphaeraceae bacterium]